jgi:hypothetical protein
MNSPWPCLEKLPTLSAAAAEWKQHVGVEAFNALCAGMYLEKANRAASSVACPHKEGCAHRLIRRGESFVGKCKDEDGLGCDDILLTTDDAAVFELNLARLGAAVAAALKCNAGDGAIGIERTRRITVAGAGPAAIFLTIQTSEKEFYDVVSTLAARFSNGFILISPTARLGAAAVELLDRAHSGILPLETNFTVLADGKLQLDDDGKKLFGQLVSRLDAPVVAAGRQITVGRLVYLPDFNDVWVDGKPYDLRGHGKARLCLEFLVDEKAFSVGKAKHFLKEIDPYVRQKGGSPKLATIQMKDYFKGGSGALQKLRQGLVLAAGKDGKYYLKVRAG